LITGYKQLEYSLEDMQQNIDIITGLYQGPLARIDENYVIVSANEAFYEVFNGKEDARGKPFVSYMSQFIKTETIVKLLDKCIKSGTGIKSADVVFADGLAKHGKIDVIPLKNRVAGKTLLITFSFKTKGLEK
jgi:two-component system CheB/CheR fusion protein